MSLQHIQKNSPRLLPKPAKFEKNPPNGYRVIRKTKCGAGGAAGAGGAGGARCSPIHKQASLAGRLIYIAFKKYFCYKILEEDIVVKLKSEQMRSEEIRSEYGGRSTKLHGCYRQLLLEEMLNRKTSVHSKQGCLFHKNGAT